MISSSNAVIQKQHLIVGRTCSDTHTLTHSASCELWGVTCAVSCRYGPKWSLVMLGRWKEGITSVSAKSSPHVLVKKSDSRLVSRGSFSAAGRLTLELYTVHLLCSATTDGPSHRRRLSPAGGKREPKYYKQTQLLQLIHCSDKFSISVGALR